MMAKQQQGGMSKKLRQAVQHANEENPNTRTRREPNTSKKERED
jgi:hypothetical protein